MNIEFSDHALYQITERNISSLEIASAVSRPDKTIKQENGKFRSAKLLRRGGKRYVLVVIS
jgi:hypothetical protein